MNDHQERSDLHLRVPYYITLVAILKGKCLVADNEVHQAEAETKVYLAGITGAPWVCSSGLVFRSFSSFFHVQPP